MRFLLAAGISTLLAFLFLRAWSAFEWSSPPPSPADEYRFDDWRRWWSFASAPLFDTDECRAWLAQVKSPRVAHRIPEDVQRAWNFRSSLAWHDHLLCSLRVEPMPTPERGVYGIRLTYLSTRWAPFVIDLAQQRHAPSIVEVEGGMGSGGGTVFLDGPRFSKVTERLDRVGFWDLPTSVPDPRNASPTEFWLIEAIERGRYHAVLRPRGRELAPVIDALFDATNPSGFASLFPFSSGIEDARIQWR